MMMTTIIIPVLMKILVDRMISNEYHCICPTCICPTHNNSSLELKAPDTVKGCEAEKKR